MVSKDADFAEISMLHGFPPKLLWLRIGNCRTSDVEDLIRSNHSYILDLIADDQRGILSLFGEGITRRRAGGGPAGEPPARH